MSDAFSRFEGGGEAGGGRPGTSLRDVGLMLLRLPPDATQRRFEAEMRKNKYAAANYRRVRTMLDRLGESDVLRLYGRDETGAYPVEMWIDDGTLPGGEKDPRYSFGSDSTRKNHYTTLVAMSTRGKCCDALASLVDDGARAHFKARLADLAGSLRGGAADDTVAGPAAPTWADVARAYADPERLGRLSPPDRLIVDWWLAGGDAFPPRRYHFGRVAVTRSSPRSLPPEQDYLFFDRRGGAFLRVAGRDEERLPPAVVKAVRDSVEADGTKRRRWLFQSRSGAARPVSDNTFGQQVKTAFERLTGTGLGINALVNMYYRRGAPSTLDT